MKQDVLAALHEGKSLSNIFARIADGTYGKCIVASETLKNLRAADPEFDRIVEKLATANGAARNAAGRAKSYAKVLARTHCQRGHPITHENSIYLRKSYRQCRACKNMTDAAAGRPMTREQAAKVLEALREGKALRAICHGLEGPDEGKRKPGLYIVRHQKLVAFRKANPRFDTLVEKQSSTPRPPSSNTLSRTRSRLAPM